MNDRQNIVHINISLRIRSQVFAQHSQFSDTFPHELLNLKCAFEVLLPRWYNNIKIYWINNKLLSVIKKRIISYCAK